MAAPRPQISKVAVGGARYVIEEGFEPPQILGDGYNIFSAIAETQPNLMIWAGNTAHLRKSDWTTQKRYLNDTPWLAPYQISSHSYKAFLTTRLGAGRTWRTQQRDEQRLSRNCGIQL